MIFSLPKALITTAGRVLHNNNPVAYSWGNTNALDKWLVAMNQKQIEKVLGVSGKIKYPLIWLVEDWSSEEALEGYEFENTTFWISCNSDVSALNENRDFSVQYKVANDFIDQLKLRGITVRNIGWSEQSNVTANKKSQQSDIWDSVIITADLRINENCMKKLYV